MIELRGMHRPDQRDVICTSGDVRQQIGNLHAALAVLAEHPLRAHHRGRVLLQERELRISHDGRRQGLAVILIEQGFRIEEVHLAGAALQEDEDATLSRRREMRFARGQRVRWKAGFRIRGEQAVLSEESGEREATEPTRAGGEEIAARLDKTVFGGHGQSRLMNSSTFMSTRARATNVAASTDSVGGVEEAMMPRQRSASSPPDCTRAFCWAWKLVRLWSSSARGARFIVRRNKYWRRCAVSGGASRSTRRASAWAASTNTGSFIIVRA